jgi:hypothetical protein
MATKNQRLTAFVASVSPDIPWHAHRVYSDQDDLNRQKICCAPASVASGPPPYAGNLPGTVGDLEGTLRCVRFHMRRALRLPREGTV